MEDIDRPERNYTFFELQERGEERWYRIKHIDNCSFEEAKAIARKEIKEKLAFDRNLRTFIDLPSSGKFRLVFITKQCQNVPLD
jgi:hypothetical protein